MAFCKVRSEARHFIDLSPIDENEELDVFRKSPTLLTERLQLSVTDISIGDGDQAATVKLLNKGQICEKAKNSRLIARQNVMDNTLPRLSPVGQLECAMGQLEPPVCLVTPSPVMCGMLAQTNSNTNSSNSDQQDKYNQQNKMSSCRRRTWDRNTRTILPHLPMPSPQHDVHTNAQNTSGQFLSLMVAQQNIQMRLVSHDSTSVVASTPSKCHSGNMKLQYQTPKVTRIIHSRDVDLDVNPFFM